MAYLSRECVEKRGLATARRPHDGKQSPGLRLAAHAMQDRLLAVPHGQRHVLLEGDGGRRRGRLCPRARALLALETISCLFEEPGTSRSLGSRNLEKEGGCPTARSSSDKYLHHTYAC